MCICQETFRIQGNNPFICGIVKDNRKSISLICIYGLLCLHLVHEFLESFCEENVCELEFLSIKYAFLQWSIQIQENCNCKYSRINLSRRKSCFYINISFICWGKTFLTSLSSKEKNYFLRIHHLFLFFIDVGVACAPYR